MVVGTNSDILLVVVGRSVFSRAVIAREMRKECLGGRRRQLAEDFVRQGHANHCKHHQPSQGRTHTADG